MRLVTGQQALQHVADRGGNLFVWPRSSRCCCGRTYQLEAHTRPPERKFEPLCEQDGIAVWAAPGLPDPDEVHLELDRRGQLRAYWNGQGWIG